VQDEQKIDVANAPISYGAFELTVGIDPHVPVAEELLDRVAEAGYAGIDLGPVGYLGTGAVLRERLESRGLGLAGGYLELPFSDHGALQQAMPELEALLLELDMAPAGARRPRPTLADAGSQARRAAPGRAAHDRSVGLRGDAWERFGEGLQKVVDHCRARGHEPTLHCETGTYVEAEWELDTALELTDIGLCLETGHQLVGGGDVLRTIDRWGDRINHVHLKDVRLDVVGEIVADGDTADAIWRRRAFCPLGAGDLPLDAILEALIATGYEGWLVVEQDLIPAATDAPGQIESDQVANREFLRARAL
jgi:inosose dehydratase